MGFNPTTNQTEYCCNDAITDESMFLNYLKIAIRTLLKNQKLSIINIFGLATGMACSLLIFLFVENELSYDRFHKDSNSIYRVVKDFINDDGSRIPDATTSAPLAAAMQREIPEVISVTRIHPSWGGTTLIGYGDTRMTEEKVWRVDSSFFDVFTFPFIKGDRKHALSDVNSVVLTESAARRYFGEEDPIGKTLKLNERDDVTVTAVMRDVPVESHFHFDFLLSFRRLPRDIETNWGGYNYYTYVKIKPGTNLAEFEQKIQGVYERNQEERYSDFYVQPLKDIHLTSKLKWELEPNGDRLYVYVFMIIGLFILIIAAINYINLSTARSSLRAKETGIRKVSGAQRTSLVFQFLLESVIISLIASLFAVAIAFALIPMVNELTQKQLQLSGNPLVIFFLLLITVLIGIVAGLFPALYLSSFRPVAVLKGLNLNEKGAWGLRKALVVVQFTISIVLIISVLIIARQMNYIQSAKLGFDKERVVIIRNASALTPAERNVFLNSVEELPGVQKAATSSNVLGQGFSTTRLRARGSEQTQQLNFAAVGFDYLEVVDIEIIEGRGFSRDFPTDTLNNGISGGPLSQSLGAIVINERAVKEFGLGAPAAGKQLIWSTDGDTTYYVDVIGVAKDFHFTSLRNEIKPFGFLVIPRFTGNFSLKLSAGDPSQTLSQLEELWKNIHPAAPFEYTFLDETFDKMYAAEARFQKIFIILVILGIIIACLGLFALATFSAERRIKEIGIRKVLGASVGHVVALLSKDFLKLVVIALFLAIPIAAYAMRMWLAGFAYRITIEWWVFVAAAGIALAIAFITISAQAFRAAIADPAESLRAE
jgi:putative ABC transport system permease protein